MNEKAVNVKKVCRKLVFLILLICTLFMLFSYSLFALDRERTIAQFHHTAWTAKDGAPSQISALAQTTDGFLWIGSARGLFRFDGIEFEKFAPPAGIELPSHNIYALEATRDGGLWISFRPSGLGFLKNGRMEIFTRPEEIPKSQVYCFASDSDGRIWAGTHDGLVLRDGANWSEIGADWNFKPQRIYTMFVDRDGTLWVATDETIVFLPRGSNSFQETGARVNAVRRFAQANDGRLLLSDSSRSVRPVPISGENSAAKETELLTGALGIIFDRDGALWITDQQGLRRVRFPERLEKRKIKIDEPEIEFFNEQNGLSGDYSNHILEDREGSIWVSTAKGLDRFRYSHFVPLNASKGFQNLTLYADNEGEIWAGSASNKTLTNFRGEEAFSENDVRNISSFYRGANGTIWWGASGGIWRQQNGRFEFFPQPKDAKTEWIWEIIRGEADGGLWIGLGDVGLVYFKDGVWENRDVPKGLLKRTPSASFHDAHGRIWLGYTENRVSLLDGENARAFTSADGIDIGRIRVIRGRDEHIWFGGELGLAYFDNGRFRSIRTASGERFGTVSGIVLAADGALWLNEIKGVVRIAPDEVRLAIENPNHQVNFQKFDFLDGLPGGTQMNWTVSTAVEASDGRIWFATDNGLTWINPARMEKNNLPPPVVVKSLMTDEKTYQSNEFLELPKGTESLRINYTALSLSVPERVHFKYRLEGFDDQWRDADTRREVFFTNLGPGNYRFQVIASNNDGVWNEEGATLEFTILPMFYQTNWFLIFCAAIVAGLVWMIYQWRVHEVSNRLHLQFEERLAERTRIAQDLHDTLLQGVISASMQLDVAADQLPADSPAKERLNRIIKLVGEVIEDGRNTLQGLRSSHTNNSVNLEREFSRIRQDSDVRGEINFRVIVEGTPRSLHPVIGDEVFHICREALINAFHHSQAKAIEVEIAYSTRNFRILVRDDGRGIDSQILRSGREGHFGLSGMRERADKIGAKLKVWSRTDAGTEIELTLPNHIAFDAEYSSPSFRLFSKIFPHRKKI